MAIMKFSKTTAAEAFAVPTLGSLDPDYDALVRKVVDLNDSLGRLRREEQTVRSELEGLIAASPTAAGMSTAVAELTGDAAAIEIRSKRTSLAEIRHGVADHEAAILAVDRRRRDLADRASRAVYAAVRPEFQRRLRALAEKLIEADALRADVERLRADVEAETGSSSALTGDVFFLGSFDRATGTSFHVQRLAKEAGVR